MTDITVTLDNERAARAIAQAVEKTLSETMRKAVERDALIETLEKTLDKHNIAFGEWASDGGWRVMDAGRFHERIYTSQVDAILAALELYVEKRIDDAYRQAFIQIRKQAQDLLDEGELFLYSEVRDATGMIMSLCDIALAGSKP